MSKEQETAMYDQPDPEEEEVEISQAVKSPEFDLALWFHCLLVGHKWKWQVRLEWAGPDNGWTHAIKPKGERCVRCGADRPLNIFRWLEFLGRGPLRGTGLTP